MPPEGDDFSAPVRYEGQALPPPPKRGGKAYGLVIGCVLPLVVLAVLAVLYKDKVSSFVGGFTQPGGLGLQHSGARLGTALAWSKLGVRQGGCRAEVSLGDFDGDGALEVLLLEVPDPSGPPLGPEDPQPEERLSLLELDGNLQRLDVSSLPVGMASRGFDFEGNGSAEIVASDPLHKPGEATAFFLLNMHPRGWLYGSAAPGTPAQLQLDASGAMAMLLDDPRHNEIRAYGANMALLGRVPNSRDSRSFVAADCDGDGADELYFAPPADSKDAELRLPGSKLDGSETWLSEWPAGRQPGSAFDLNGDGREELFCGPASYYDPDSRTVTDLAYPAQFKAAAPQFDAPLPFDVDGDGAMEIVCRGGDGRNSALLGFLPTGACVYFEELGEEIERLDLLDDGGRPRLLLLTDKQLLLSK